MVYTEAEAEATHLSHEAGPRCSTTCTWPEQKGKTVSASAAAAASRVPVSRGDRAASCTDSRDNTPAVRVCVRGGPYTKPTETPIQTYTDTHETSETTYCEHCGSPPNRRSPSSSAAHLERCHSFRRIEDGLLMRKRSRDKVRFAVQYSGSQYRAATWEHPAWR